MRYMTTAEIRESFLKYFEGKGCKRMRSSSLIPDDPSLLLTSAGMVQFKPYFLQQKKLPAPYIGTTTVQKCVRTNDIDIIGSTGRHLSFFEMLGNFSFGEYFKEEMCEWALDFSVNVMGLPKDRLYFTVYKDDDETIEIWKNLGIDTSHITRLGDEDNFWRAGPTGPCGPCSELYFDQGEDFGCGSPDCAPGCDCDRFLEYWNCVFTQYDAQEDGTLVPLPKKNIDTGMGLERMAAIMQNVQSNYETDILRSLVAVGETLFNVKYGDDPETDKTLRIIADHSRAITFMIGDGILPGNEGREYVLRRLLRRCVVKAFLLDYEGTFLDNYILEVMNTMGDVYPEILDNKNLILSVVKSEEERFGKTLRQGSLILDKLLSTRDKNFVLPGDKVFVMHDTYGFPVEVTKEIAQDKGFTIDEAGFEKCMEQQRERARAANAQDSDAAWEIDEDPTEGIEPTDFLGYDKYDCRSRVIAIVKDNKRVFKAEPGDEVSIYVKHTTFYGEMGGQVGDTGMLSKSKVINATHPRPDLIAHIVKADEEIKLGDVVDICVDKKRRDRISRNHSATHILHAVLRKVLGDHVNQAGSYVAPNRLRFDFTHFEALSADQLKSIEQQANDMIMSSVDVDTYVTSLDDARKKGVTALFGEKYGDVVRVVDMGDFSKELCGGCHVHNTSEIGLVKITAETSVGANARRIEAVTSYDAYDYCNTFIATVNEACVNLRCPATQVNNSITSLKAKIKALDKEIETAYSKSSFEQMTQAYENLITTKNGYKLAAKNLGNIQVNDIKESWDIIKHHCDDNCACVIAGIKNGKALLMAAGTKNAVDAGFNANDVIKELAPMIQGGGGGNPRMAQAGGKNTDNLDEVIEKAIKMLT